MSYIAIILLAKIYVARLITSHTDHYIQQLIHVHVHLFEAFIRKHTILINDKTWILL